MRINSILGVFLVAVLACGHAVAQNGFENLAHIGHSTTIGLERKDGSCESGWIVKATPASVTVQQYKKPPVTVAKDLVLRVDELNGGAHDVIYSARSSWQDVLDAKPLSTERLIVVTKNGKKYSVKSSKVTSDGIESTQTGGVLNLPKSSVSTVDYLRQRPISDGEEYLLQEAPVVMLFNPDTWARAAHLVPRFSVRIFDASRPEEGPLPKCPVKSPAP